MNNYIPSKEKMDGTTTNNETYKAWPIERNIVKPKSSFVSVPDDRDFKSVNNSTYVPLPVTNREQVVRIFINI